MLDICQYKKRSVRLFFILHNFTEKKRKLYINNFKLRYLLKRLNFGIYTWGSITYSTIIYEYYVFESCLNSIIYYDAQYENYCCISLFQKTEKNHLIMPIWENVKILLCELTESSFNYNTLKTQFSIKYPYKIQLLLILVDVVITIIMYLHTIKVFFA